MAHKRLTKQNHAVIGSGSDFLLHGHIFGAISMYTTRFLFRHDIPSLWMDGSDATSNIKCTTNTKIHQLVGGFSYCKISPCGSCRPCGGRWWKYCFL